MAYILQDADLVREDHLDKLDPNTVPPAAEGRLPS